MSGATLLMAGCCCGAVEPCENQYTIRQCLTDNVALEAPLVQCGNRGGEDGDSWWPESWIEGDYYERDITGSRFELELDEYDCGGGLVWPEGWASRLILNTSSSPSTSPPSIRSVHFALRSDRDVYVGIRLTFSDDQTALIIDDMLVATRTLQVQPQSMLDCQTEDYNCATGPDGAWEVLYLEKGQTVNIKIVNLDQWPSNYWWTARLWVKDPDADTSEKAAAVCIEFEDLTECPEPE